MKKIRNLLALLIDVGGKNAITWLLGTTLPIIIMLGFAVFLAIKFGYSLIMLSSCAVAVLIAIFCTWLSAGKNKPSDHAMTNRDRLPDELVSAGSDWSAQELRIWNDAKHRVREQLATELTWKELDTAAVNTLEFVAEQFGKKALDFTVPEALQLFEEVSRRYKRVIQNSIPAIELLKVAHIKHTVELYQKHGEKAAKIADIAFTVNKLRNAVISPVNLISDYATAKAFSGLSQSVQLAAKKALLDEVAAVAIDLYSGRFSIEDNDIRVSKVAEQDEQRLAADLEPVRLVLVGQTGVGKSSLVNLLQQEFVAEVDALPSTDAVCVYQGQVDGLPVQLVDLQGLDGSQQAYQQTLNEMVQADLVLWLLKANQSSRNLDKQLKDSFEQFYQQPENLSRQKPKVILVLNQVDKLKPVHEWQPPYRLDHADTAKGKMINEALLYNQALLNPEQVLPLSIADNKPHFGAADLQQAIMDSLDLAKNVQRSRQRVEAQHKPVALTAQLARVKNTVTHVVNSL